MSPRCGYEAERLHGAWSCIHCGQPMLPHGMPKRPNEYDHASGCQALRPTPEQCRAWSALIDSFGTRRALAIQLGVSESTVWRWMHRHHPSEPTKNAVNALCTDRNVTPIYGDPR